MKKFIIVSIEALLKAYPGKTFQMMTLINLLMLFTIFDVSGTISGDMKSVEKPATTGNIGCCQR